MAAGRPPAHTSEAVGAAREGECVGGAAAAVLGGTGRPAAEVPAARRAPSPAGRPGSAEGDCSPLGERRSARKRAGVALPAPPPAAPRRLTQRLLEATSAEGTESAVMAGSLATRPAPENSPAPLPAAPGRSAAGLASVVSVTARCKPLPAEA